MSVDPTRALLQAAIDNLASVDRALESMHAGAWMLVVEHEGVNNEKTVSIFRSMNLMPWTALGLLRFAQFMEEERAVTDADDSDNES